MWGIDTTRALIGSDVNSLVLIYIEPQLEWTWITLDWQPFKIFAEKFLLNLTVKGKNGCGTVSK